MSDTPAKPPMGGLPIKTGPNPDGHEHAAVAAQRIEPNDAPAPASEPTAPDAESVPVPDVTEG